MSAAREAVAAICIQGDEIPYRYYGKADKILAALRPIIATEIRAWAENEINSWNPAPRGFSLTEATAQCGAFQYIREDADAIAERITTTTGKRTGMPDDLRTRIAAVLRSALLEVDYSDAQESADGEQWVFIDGTVIPENLADAVIRELGPLVRYWDKDFKELHYCRECGGWGPMDD